LKNFGEHVEDPSDQIQLATIRLAEATPSGHFHYFASNNQRKQDLVRQLPSPRQQTRLMVNFREDRRGHLWQGRFASFILDERFLVISARCVELNAARAGLINAPGRDR
jgi:putative transposase